MTARDTKVVAMTTGRPDAPDAVALMEALYADLVQHHFFRKDLS